MKFLLVIFVFLFDDFSVMFVAWKLKCIAVGTLRTAPSDVRHCIGVRIIRTVAKGSELQPDMKWQDHNSFSFLYFAEKKIELSSEMIRWTVGK